MEYFSGLYRPAGDKGETQQLTALCNGLLLPGGIDVDPIAYGEAPHSANSQSWESAGDCSLETSAWAEDGIPEALEDEIGSVTFV